MSYELGPDVTIRDTGTFGEMLTWPDMHRAGTVILATRHYGLKPYRLLLPHQVYSRDVEAIIDYDHPEVWALPVPSPAPWRLLAYRTGAGAPATIG